MLQRKIVVLHHLTQTLLETLRIQQFAKPYSAPGHFIFVGRADAASGGTDRLFSARPLTRLVQCDVVGKYQRAGLADTETLDCRYATLVQHIQLFQQRTGREHHAVSDQAAHAFAKYAGRYQVQNRLLSIDYQRMAGIVPTLKAHHRLRTIGQKVDDLAFTLISPLGTDYNNVFTHYSVLSCNSCIVRVCLKKLFRHSADADDGVKKSSVSRQKRLTG